MIALLRQWYEKLFSDPQVVILWLILLAGFSVIFFFGSMLQPVFVALIIAYLLEGIISRISAIGIPRMIAVGTTFGFFLICLILFVLWLFPLLFGQVAELMHQIPSLVSNGQKQLMELPQRYPEFISEMQIKEIISMIRQELTQIGQTVLVYSVTSLRNIITWLVYLILVPFLVFFFLKDKDEILQWFSGLIPSNADLAGEVWNHVNRQIGNYVRGKIWEILIVWAASYITFSILGLNFSLLISLFIGLSVLIPYIGATVITIPVALMAFFQWGFDSHFVYVLIAYGIIQLIDGNILVPLLLSEVVDLHPVAIIISVLIFGGMWGVWGLFLAIPLATLVHAVMRAWLLHKTTPAQKVLDT